MNKLWIGIKWLQKPIRGCLILVGFPVLFTNALDAADLVWIGGTGNWNAAGNWSPAQVPGAADNAIITNNGTYTVTVPAGSTGTAGTLSLGGASGVQTLAIDRAMLTLNGASVVNTNGELALTVSQSALTGAGNLSVNGMLNWANGTMSGAGTTTINRGGVLAIGSGGVTFGRTLNHGGIGTWSGGNLTMSVGVAFNNLAGGIFDITADGRLSGSATTPINNSGLFRQTATTASTIITAPFNNSDTLEVMAATLMLDLGGTHTGTMIVDSGAVLNLSGGNHILAAISSVTGAGTLAISGNATTLTANGTFEEGSTLNVTAGIATLSSGCIVTSARLDIDGGVLRHNTVDTVAVINLTGGTLGGTSPITVTGPLTLTGGTITNSLVTAAGGLVISGNTTLNGGKLVNPETAIWSAGNFIGANGAVFSNLFGATFDNTFDGNAGSGAGATPIFVNDGSFRKSGATAPLGTTSIDFEFINTGLVEVRTNLLRYGINQQTTGLTLLDGGGLSAQAQPIQLLGGRLVGTGAVTVANTQNLLNSARISPGLALGELDISGNYQQTAAGMLDIELGGYSPGTNFDVIAVTGGGAGGVATLAGTLNITITNGFSPTNGATFVFLRALSRVGAFATFNYPSNEIGMQLTLDATSASVKVTNLKPVVAAPIADTEAITYGVAFNFQFPANTFTDPDNNVLSYSASGMPAGITFTASTRTFFGTPTQTGIFRVAVVAKDDGTPSLTVTNTFNITVNPATLTIAADPKTKTYGATDPTLTFTVDGLQLTDTAATVLTGGLIRAGGEGVAGSPYAIEQGMLAANANYTIGFTGATLSITPIPLSITADAKTRTYGAADPAFTASYAGFVNGETPAVLGSALSLFRALGENVGNYLITPGGLTSGNYTISFNTGLLSITKAALTVTADAKTKIYGAVDPPFTAMYAGFVNGETPIVLSGSLAFSRATGEGVGSYIVTPSGLTSTNYAITFNTGSITITQTALSITADAKSKARGATDPSFTVTYSGFVNNESPTSLGGTLTFTRDPGESAGNYPITSSGLTSANYAISFIPGTLTITPAPAPVILAITSASPANIMITWSSVSNVPYRVQYKSDVMTANWTDLAGDILAGAATASKTDIRAASNRFYRIHVLP